MSSKRHLKRRNQAKQARRHDGKQAHATETAAIAHAYAVRKNLGGKVQVYKCKVGGSAHWHIGH